jgi:hypothetical protein
LLSGIFPIIAGTYIAMMNAGIFYFRSGFIINPLQCASFWQHGAAEYSRGVPACLVPAEILKISKMVSFLLIFGNSKYPNSL